MTFLDFATATGKQRKELIAKARKASELMKALSHEGRLLMLCLLAEGEKTVTEIGDIMDMPQAGVSQQLARLRLDGLVAARRDGRSIHYSIASKDAQAILSTLHGIYCGPERPALRRRH